MTNCQWSSKETQGSSYMETIWIIFLMLYVAATATILILSMYFFRHYIAKKSRVSFIWCLGFFFFAIATAHYLLRAYEGITRTEFLIELIIFVLAVVLFYYGTSLLFFKEGSFFREKMAALILGFYLALFLFLVYITPPDRLIDGLRVPTQIGLMMPVFSVIAVFFYVISQRIDPGDPSRQRFFCVSIAWFLLAFDSLYEGFFWLESLALDLVARIFQTMAWFLMLYGMTIRRTAAFNKSDKIQDFDGLKTQNIAERIEEKPEFQYDIAISFAGEDRKLAEDLARALQNKGVKVFYDVFYKHELWGKRLTTYFQDIYGPKTRFVVPVISKYFPIKDWTDFEFSIMRKEAKKRKIEFILPIRLDDTKILGIHEDVGYLDLRLEGIDSIVDCLLKKLEMYGMIFTND
jgi:hypothetical protein